MIYRGGHRSDQFGQELCHPFKEFEPRNRIRALRQKLEIEYNPISEKGLIFYRDSLSGELNSCTPENFILLSHRWGREYDVSMKEDPELGKDAFIMRPYLED